jgi:glycoside/pentoside/hexuronide:cation symporter, GPH family
MTTDRARLTVLDKVGYGFGDFASNFFWQMFAIFIAKYYTDVFLLGAATMGTMMLVTRSADAIIDPLIGIVADRTRTRFGRFRPYLLWMPVPLAIAAIATFTVPSLEGSAKIVYAYVTLTLLMFCYSAINIPYSALFGVLSPDSAERSTVSSYRFVFGFLPIFILVWFTDDLVKYFGGSSISPHGWQSAMVVYSLIALVFFVLTFLLTRERVQPVADHHQDLRADLKDLRRNRPWVILSFVGVAALTCGNMRSAVILYYFDYVVPNGHGAFGTAMTIGAVGFLVGVAACAPLVHRYGKKSVYTGSMLTTAALTVAFYFVPVDRVMTIWVLHGLISLATAPTAPIIWSMYADTADYSEWKSGRRATGLVFSAASFSQKVGWALGGAGTGWLLAYFGYVPNVAQSPATVHGIVLMMSLIPAAVALLAVAVLRLYPLDETAVKRMAGELASQRQGSAA